METRHEAAVHAMKQPRTSHVPFGIACPESSAGPSAGPARRGGGAAAAAVDLIAPPFSGHLHPLLGIGRRLACDGLRVRVISTESAQARIIASGLEPLCVLAGADDAVHAIAEPPEAVRSNPFRLNAQFRANLALLGRFQEELRAHYRQHAPHLAIVDFTLPLAGFIARELGVPWWTSLPSPCALETPDGPPTYLGGLQPRDDLIGRVRDAAGRLLVRSFKRTVVYWHRETLRALGLPKAYREDGSEAAYSPECILALGLRELEFARRWPPAVRFVGPVRYTPPGLGQMPPFVPGHRHVLVSLGTHLPQHKDRIAAATRAAAQALPHLEFHFTDGRVRADVRVDAHAYDNRHAPANFHRLPFIDYGLLPRYDLVVHHAGAGILNETIAAGLPAIVLPLDYDQFDNAARLQTAGLAMRLRSLADLPRAIEQALASENGGDAASLRAHYRDLMLKQDTEARISALVRERLAGVGVGESGPPCSSRS
jgi:UDP:flavonoid glycosyltransferase YjiC (YdhE family)